MDNAGLLSTGRSARCATSGVDKAAVVSAMPFIPANINIQGNQDEGRPAPPEREQPVTSLTVASPDYFAAMSIPCGAAACSLRTITERAAGRHHQRPAGRSLLAGREPARSAHHGELARTMADDAGGRRRLRHDGLDRDPRPEVFIPFAQLPYGSMTFVVRTTTDAALLIATLKKQIWDVDPNLPLCDTSTIEALVAQSLAPRRFITSLLTVLAGLAFVLATIGIYGIVSFATSQRTREIGVRVAVGGSTRDILRLVFTEGAQRVAVGVLVGLAGSLAVTRVVATLLYQVSPNDPLTLGTTTALLAVVALLALLPARRATRVDPLVALRSD